MIDVNLGKALQCAVNISISVQRVEAGMFKAVLLTLGKSLFLSVSHLFVSSACFYCLLGQSIPNGTAIS